MEIVIGIIVIFVIYLIATSKKRRERIIFNTIYQMIATGQTDAIIPIYTEVATKFAIDHGGSINTNPNFQLLFAECQVKINGINYFIMFAHNDHGTHINVVDYDKFNHDFQQKLNKVQYKR